MSFAYLPPFGFIFPSFLQYRNNSCEIQKEIVRGGTCGNFSRNPAKQSILPTSPPLRFLFFSPLIQKSQRNRNNSRIQKWNWGGGYVWKIEQKPRKTASFAYLPPPAISFLFFPPHPETLAGYKNEIEGGGYVWKIEQKPRKTASFACLPPPQISFPLLSFNQETPQKNNNSRIQKEIDIFFRMLRMHPKSDLPIPGEKEFFHFFWDLRTGVTEKPSIRKKWPKNEAKIKKKSKIKGGGVRTSKWIDPRFWTFGNEIDPPPHVRGVKPRVIFPMSYNSNQVLRLFTQSIL